MTLNSKSNWQVIETRQVVDAAPWLQLSVQSVRLPDGRVVDDYYQLAMPDFAIVYATTADRDLLLLKQYKHGLRRSSFTLPGGHVEAGETPIDAAKRELLEETGYCSQEWEDLGSFVTHGNLRMNTGHFFRARNSTQIAEAHSGDLEAAKLILKNEVEISDWIAGGAVPLLHHAAAIAFAMIQ